MSHLSLVHMPWQVACATAIHGQWQACSQVAWGCTMVALWYAVVAEQLLSWYATEKFSHLMRWGFVRARNSLGASNQRTPERTPDALMQAFTRTPPGLCKHESSSMPIDKTCECTIGQVGYHEGAL